VCNQAKSIGHQVSSIESGLTDLNVPLFWQECISIKEIRENRSCPLGVGSGLYLFVSENNMLPGAAVADLAKLKGEQR